MSGKNLSLNHTMMLIISVVWLSISGCSKSTQSLETMPETSICKDAKVLAWGKKGEDPTTANELWMCYDWEMRADK